MKILAVIPIRSGSKSIPDKNIYPLQGKPLVYYALTALINSEICCDICVSSDSDRYLEVCKSISPSVYTIKRSCDIAGDKTPDVPVLKNCVDTMHRDYKRSGYTHVLLVHATSPLVNPKDFIDALRLFMQDPLADSLVSVSELDVPLAKIKRIVNGYILDLPGNPVEKTTSRRQDWPTLYARNGAFYLMTIDQLMSDKMWGQNVIPYIMPKARSVDINHFDDLLIADALISHRFRSAD